ncbi:tyrosine-type recombinase/integrase [Maribacter sp. 2307UL18-2]|uniref:tyrosine-type recombinase/integrase n=1 Tax=Maribacter sp. 2307UL18-2 TaxID=3386274 RepID=UPI0039BCE5CF
MAKVKLILDTRKSSKKSDGTYPICIRVFHKKPRIIPSKYSTTMLGWDGINCKLRKSVGINKNLDCDNIGFELDEMLYQAKGVLNELGNSIHRISIDRLLDIIKDKWDYNPKSELKKKIQNDISLTQWGNVLIARKEAANRAGTAKWYQDGIAALVKFNGGKDLKLYDITVTYLKNFEAYQLGMGNSINTISIYLRAIRSIYNAAIDEDQFTPIKDSFKVYKIPSSTRTKKRSVTKEKISNIKNLKYEPNSAFWHAKNYLMTMFYCRGMNFIDLVQIKVEHITDMHLFYGRSKSGQPFAIKIVPELRMILDYYLKDKEPNDYLFPTNYDGSTENFQKYKSQRRRMNERLKVIAKDAGIKGDFTTYYIRHSWATIAKFMGISTALISESLGHSSITTTEIYLRDFENDVLDEVNAKVVS